jgi:hypothetical protein
VQLGDPVVKAAAGYLLLSQIPESGDHLFSSLLKKKITSISQIKAITMRKIIF